METFSNGSRCFAMLLADVIIVVLFKVGFLNYMAVYCFHLTWHQHGLNSENLWAQHWVDAAENSHRHIGLVTRYFIRENFLKNNL